LHVLSFAFHYLVRLKGGCGCDFSLHLNCIFVLFAAPFIKSLN